MFLYLKSFTAFIYYYYYYYFKKCIISIYKKKLSGVCFDNIVISVVVWRKKKEQL